MKVTLHLISMCLFPVRLIWKNFYRGATFLSDLFICSKEIYYICLYTHRNLEVPLKFWGDYVICGTVLPQYAVIESQVNTDGFDKGCLNACQIRSLKLGLHNCFSFCKIFPGREGGYHLEKTTKQNEQEKQHFEDLEDRCHVVISDGIFPGQMHGEAWKLHLQGPAQSCQATQVSASLSSALSQIL